VLRASKRSQNPSIDVLVMAALATSAVLVMAALATSAIFGFGHQFVPCTAGFCGEFG
jgi:hypothetical protein